MALKVKAFTLNELVIVMIITTIVVGLAFTVLSLVKKQLYAIQGNFSLNMEYNRLEESLWIDTNKFNNINYNSRNKQLIFRTLKDSTTYIFSEDNVIKNRDTFRIPTKLKKVMFDGQEVKSGKIDAIHIALEKPFIDQDLFVYKLNDANQFMD